MSKSEKNWQTESDAAIIQHYAQLKASPARYRAAIKCLREQRDALARLPEVATK